MTTVTSRARPASVRCAARRRSGSGQVRVPSGTTRQTRLPSRSAPASDSSTKPVTWSGASRSPTPPTRAALRGSAPPACTCSGRSVVVVMEDTVLPGAERACRRSNVPVRKGSALDLFLRGEQGQLVRPGKGLPVTGDADRERSGDGGRGQPVADIPAEQARGE